MAIKTKGQTPEVIEKLTLGQSVLLGELYDQRRAQFLGVQLYDQANIEKATATTNVNYSELTLTMANSFESKASVLDINANLSIEVLGGLAKVKGSASYLRDTAASTDDLAWAMVLKMRLAEKRLLFAQDSLSEDVLDLVLKDYIAQNAATHFVSSITYGGSLIVNLVANKSNITDKEKVEGSLEVELEQLKGLVNVTAGANVTISADTAALKNKFDLKVYGDVALQQVPVNAEQVLTAFPDAANLLRIEGGVPISVVLQPIPPDLFEKASVVYNIDQELLHHLLDAFGRIEDLNSRFTALQYSGEKYSSFVPALSASINDAFIDFQTTRRSLLQALSRCIKELLKGSANDAEPVKEVAKEAEKLRRVHLTHTSAPAQPSLPSQLHDIKQKALKLADEGDTVDVKISASTATLVAFERQLSIFQDFVVRLEALGFELNTIDDLSMEACTSSSVPLFLMPPLTSSGRDIKMIRFFGLLRKLGIQYLKSAQSCIILYVENPAILNDRFPNPGEFDVLATPAVYAGTISDDGILTWQTIVSGAVGERGGGGGGNTGGGGGDTGGGDGGTGDDGGGTGGGNGGGTGGGGGGGGGALCSCGEAGCSCGGYRGDCLCDSDCHCRVGWGRGRE